MVGERLHPVDEGDDSIGLVADQLRQLAPGRISVLLEQLGRAADSGQRVLDLMREHRGHRRDRSGSVRTSLSAPSPVSAPWIVTERLPNRGPSSSMSYSEIVLPTRQTESMSDSRELCGATKSPRRLPDSAAAPEPKNCSAAVLTKRMRSPRSITITGSGSAPRIAAASSPGAATEPGVALGAGALP